MSKQLYEEALADARQIKQVAEDNAKRAIIDLVTPRIRSLIERQIISELDTDEKIQGKDDEENILVDDLMSPEYDDSAQQGQPGAALQAQQLPTLNTKGGVTVDVGNIVNPRVGCATALPTPQPPAVPQPPMLTLPPSTVNSSINDPMASLVGAETATPAMDVDEFELSLETADALKAVARAARPGLIKVLNSATKKLGESICRFRNAGVLISGTSGYRSQILEMISRVENMYECVQESITDPAEKKRLESQLELYYRDLNKLRETTKMKNKLNESDVTLKLTGLPDDVDLDGVGVDLISDEGEEASSDDNSDELDLDDDDGGDAGDGDGDENDDLDVTGEASMDEMDDDTMVEIDEGMLRREIVRMRKINEAGAAGKSEHMPWSASGGVDSKEAHSFGGGCEEDEVFQDGEVTTGGAEPLGEADMAGFDEASMSMDEMDEIGDEELGETQLKRKESDYGSRAANTHSVQAEARLAFEKRLQRRLTERLAQLKKLHSNAAAKRDAAKIREAKTAWNRNVKRLTESRARVQRLNRLMAETIRRNGASQNGGLRRSAETGINAKKLREKLVQVNLNNAKLLHTNKLLQNESLTARQKQQIVERLDEAMTVREVKLVYESLVKTLVNDRKQLTESVERRVIGSGSRTTRSAGLANLNESTEAARWARLAGITK